MQTYNQRRMYMRDEKIIVPKWIKEHNTKEIALGNYPKPRKRKSKDAS